MDEKDGLPQTHKITIILPEALYRELCRKARAETKTGQIGPYVREHMTRVADKDIRLPRRRRA